MYAIRSYYAYQFDLVNLGRQVLTNYAGQLQGEMIKAHATKTIFLSGVGGQGTILASNILGQVLLEAVV